MQYGISPIGSVSDLGSTTSNFRDAYHSGTHYNSSRAGFTASSTAAFTPIAPFHMFGANDANGNTMIVGTSTIGAGIILDDIATAKWRLGTGGYCLNFQQHTSATAGNYSNAAFTTKMYIDSNSAIHATGGLITTSDSNIKTNIVPIKGALDRLCLLKGCSFDYRYPELHNGQSNAYGFIAQEVREIFPDWVVPCPQPDPDEALELQDEPLLGLNISNGFYAHVVESIKELKRENDELKDSLATLTARLVALEGASS
jgi:hypothetical protein